MTNNEVTVLAIAIVHGFPVGDYTIDVLVDGKSVETRRVKVE